LDGQKYPDLEFDGQNQTLTAVEWLKMNFSYKMEKTRFIAFKDPTFRNIPLKFDIWIFTIENLVETILKHRKFNQLKQF
jgi:hypothetical protein